MPEEYIVPNLPSVINEHQLSEEVRAVFPESLLNKRSDGTMRVITVNALNTTEQATLATIIENHIAVDYEALSQAAKPSAQDVISDIEALYDVSAAHYNSLTNQQKAAIFTILTTGWGTATAAQKADAIRSTLALIVISIYFIYLKLIGE